MRATHIFRSLLGVGAVVASWVSVPAAHAASPTPVSCSEAALADAVNAANLAGGGSLSLAPFCTYTLTRAHSAGGAGGPAGLPNITTPISMTGFGTEITRAPGVAAFRIFEVDGPSRDPAAHGQLALTAVTVSGGDAGWGVGGGIANLGGMVTITFGGVRNSRASYGGGIYSDTSLTLTASTVNGNTATVNGGGIYKNSGVVALTGSLVYGNTLNNCGATPPATPDC